VPIWFRGFLFPLKAIAMKLERIIEQLIVRYFEKDLNARVYTALETVRPTRSVRRQ
jgi:hypothetical protein